MMQELDSTEQSNPNNKSVSDKEESENTESSKSKQNNYQSLGHLVQEGCRISRIHHPQA